MPDGIGGDSANALIWRSGGDGCGFNAAATNAAVHLKSIPKMKNRFTIARTAAKKCANGTNWLCGNGVRNGKRRDCHSCN